MMSRMIPTATIALFVVALLVAALASSATAAAKDRVEVDSRVTLAESDPFHGKVISKQAACERNRTVEVYNVLPGSDGLYGSTTSNAKGEWEIPASPNGRFYAVVKERKINAGGTTLVCEEATSPKVRF